MKKSNKRHRRSWNLPLKITTYSTSLFNATQAPMGGMSVSLKGQFPK